MSSFLVSRRLWEVVDVIFVARLGWLGAFLWTRLFGWCRREGFEGKKTNRRAARAARMACREADWEAKQCRRYVATKDYGSPGHDRVLGIDCSTLKAAMQAFSLFCRVTWHHFELSNSLDEGIHIQEDALTKKYGVRRHQTYKQR